MTSHLNTEALSTRECLRVNNFLYLSGFDIRFYLVDIAVYTIVRQYIKCDN